MAKKTTDSIGEVSMSDESVGREILAIFDRENYSLHEGVSTLFALICNTIEMEGTLERVEFTTSKYTATIAPANDKTRSTKH